ncbi:hypothetical protein C8F01DRAFT_1098929 [Mycena amicta]|nr:hypothetical protein C8F01DRAFT_1098929 [Mycena amicta]
MEHDGTTPSLSKPTMNNSARNPRVALVTGAAQGIGRAIALRLARDGLDVGVADLPSKIGALEELVKEIEALATGRKVCALGMDVSKEEQVSGMVAEVVEKLGRLDVMVANAGVGGSGYVKIMDADVSDWEKLWEVNIRGVLLCYKYAARQMIKQGDGGRIIGASSVAGIRGYAGVGGYCVSKAAVRSLTQTAALELREHRITVNAYAPGAIDTAMIASPVDETRGVGYAIKEAFRIPQEFRTGQPEDVAAVVSFVASEGAHFVTGETVSVNDGCLLS